MSAELRLIDQAEADRLFRERTNPEAEGPVHFPEFQSAHLRDVTLHMSALAGPVNFSRSVLERVHLRGSNLDDAGFDQTRLTDCDLSHLNGARLWAEGAVFEGCDFTQSYLRRSHFKSARLERCDLTRAELAASFAVGASFRGCVLDRTDFDLAWLDSADSLTRGAVRPSFAARTCAPRGCRASSSEAVISPTPICVARI